VESSRCCEEEMERNMGKSETETGEKEDTSHTETETEEEAKGEGVKAAEKMKEKEQGMTEDDEALTTWKMEKGMMTAETEQQEARRQGGRLAQEQSVK
jgi:hypothetical protein